MSNEKEIKEINEINDYIKSRSEYKIGRNIRKWIKQLNKTKEKSNEKHE
tara:strand:- start:237 stop:383 length:147 start_codon:yes stop_codon:yes gene_type:complete